MFRSLRRVCLPLLALSLAALPAAAEVFYVKLNNGTTLETAYQPQAASWDAGLVLLLTEVGNWIGVDQDEIESVTSETQSRGFGIRINTTTVYLGVAPNDAPVPGQEPPADPLVQALQSLSQAQQPPAERSDYTIQQFVEPNETQGIPSGFINPYAINPQQ